MGVVVMYRLMSSEATPTEGMYGGKICGYAFVMRERWRMP